METTILHTLAMLKLAMASAFLTQVEKERIAEVVRAIERVITNREQ